MKPYKIYGNIKGKNRTLNFFPTAHIRALKCHVICQTLSSPISDIKIAKMKKKKLCFFFFNKREVRVFSKYRKKSKKKNTENKAEKEGNKRSKDKIN